MTDRIPVARREAALLARRAELQARITAVEAELDSHTNPDWEELATERETDEVLEAEGLAAQAELRAIKGALGRILTGDYGFCTRCGGEIAAGRLDTLPATPFCNHCAA